MRVQISQVGFGNLTANLGMSKLGCGEQPPHGNEPGDPAQNRRAQDLVPREPRNALEKAAGDGGLSCLTRENITTSF